MSDNTPETGLSVEEAVAQLTSKEEKPEETPEEQETTSEAET